MDTIRLGREGLKSFIPGLMRVRPADTAHRSEGPFKLTLFPVLQLDVRHRTMHQE